MTAIRVRKDHFSGLSKVATRDVDGLSAIIRAMLIDNARTKLEVAGVTQFTDNSTGTASAEPYGEVDVPIAASGVFDATSAGGVQRSAFNTSVGKINNAHAVIGLQINQALSRLGMAPVTGLATGTIATAGTIPALDLTATTAASTSAVDYASFVTVTTILKANHLKILRAARRVWNAMGLSDTTDTQKGIYAQDFVLAAPGTIAAAATGASSVALADGTAMLAAIANNLATVAAKWNGLMIGAGQTSLTDSSGGTANVESILGAIGTFTPFTSVATDCTPKAGFDTLLGVYRNTFASFAARANLLAKQLDLPLITDSTSGSATTTIAATAASLSAVTGTTVCLEVVSGLAALNAIKANFATMAAYINTYLVPQFDLVPLTDSTGGVADITAPVTLVAMPTTATGVSGAALSSVANTESNTDLAAAQIDVATMAAKLNEMLGTTHDYLPLTVVAA